MGIWHCRDISEGGARPLAAQGRSL